MKMEHVALNVADGSHLIAMRDPWGLAIQFCERNTPLLKFT